MRRRLQLRPPMSAVIPCTRATAQRVTFQAVRCRRFASTETVAVDAAPTTPILPARREQRLSTREPDLSQRLHRALYPHLYGEDGQFTRGELVRMKRRKQKKPIDSKWQSVMKQKSVDAQLSTATSQCLPTLLHVERQFNGTWWSSPDEESADSIPQAINSAYPSSSPQRSTSRKPVPIPSQP